MPVFGFIDTQPPD